MSLQVQLLSDKKVTAAFGKRPPVPTRRAETPTGDAGLRAGRTGSSSEPNPPRTDFSDLFAEKSTLGGRAGRPVDGFGGDRFGFLARGWRLFALNRGSEEDRDQ